MIKHIVMWTLKENAEGSDRKENAQKAKFLLESLNGKIPGLIKLEMGTDLIGTENTADIIVYSEFESEKSLAEYYTHPEHVKCIPFINSIRDERFLMDYKI